MSARRAAPGESARQFAAAQAAASRTASSAEDFKAKARANPASAESPHPTVERTGRERAGANTMGASAAVQKSNPSAPRLIAALHAPRERSLRRAEEAAESDSIGVSNRHTASSRLGFTNCGLAASATRRESLLASRKA